MLFLIENYFIFMQIPLKYVSGEPIENKLSLDQVMSWNQTGHKPNTCIKYKPIRSSGNDSTGFWPPGSLHTLGADGHI